MYIELTIIQQHDNKNITVYKKQQCGRVFRLLYYTHTHNELLHAYRYELLREYHCTHTGVTHVCKLIRSKNSQNKMAS